MPTVQIRCAHCGREIIGVVNRDVFPVRNIHAQTGEDFLDSVLVCRQCFDAIPDE